VLTQAEYYIFSLQCRGSIYWTTLAN